MKSACVGVLSIIELKNARWNIEIPLHVSSNNAYLQKVTLLYLSGVPKGGLGGSNPPPPRNSEDIGGVLDRMSKMSWRLDFLLQFTVLSYGCNLLNKSFF